MSDSPSRGRLAELDAQFRAAVEQRQQGRLTAAESLFSELIEGYAKVGCLDRSAMAGINRAQVLQQTGKLAVAASQYEDSLAVATQIGDQRRVAFCLGGLSTLRREEGNQGEAERLIEESLHIFRDLDDSVGIGNQLGNLGVLRQSQGRLEEALACYSEAAEHFATAGNAAGAVGVLQCLGELHRRQGELDEAEAAHVRALDLSRQRGIRIAEAHSLRALGQLARVRGSLAESRLRIQAGLTIHKELGDLRGELASLVDLGMVEFARGEGAEAIKHLDICVARGSEAGLVVPVCKALLNRALYRLDTEHLDLVEADLGGARELLEKLGDQEAWNVWSVTTARTLIRRAKWDQARALLEKELERAETANLGAVRAAIIGLLASVEQTCGRTDRARQLFDEAESLYRAVGDYEGAQIALLSRARLLAETGALEQAESAIDTLLDGLGEDSQYPILRAEAFLASAAVSDLLGDYEAALEAAEEARALFEGANFQICAVGTGLTELKYLVRQGRERLVALPDGSVERAEELRAVVETLQTPTLETIAWCILADVQLLMGEQKSSQTWAKRALEQAHALDFPDGEAQALEVLARAEQSRHTAALAARKLRAIHSTARADRVAREWSLSDQEIEGDGVE